MLRIKKFFYWKNDKINNIDFNIKSSKRDSIISLFWNDIVEDNLKVSFNSKMLQLLPWFYFQINFCKKFLLKVLLKK